jgi:hypothetical protein
VFVLSNSVKNKNLPSRKLEHIFVEEGIPVYIALSDDSKINEEV